MNDNKAKLEKLIAGLSDKEQFETGGIVILAGVVYINLSMLAEGPDREKVMRAWFFVVKTVSGIDNLHIYSHNCASYVKSDGAWMTFRTAFKNDGTSTEISMHESRVIFISL